MTTNGDPARLTTTLNRLKAAGACAARYRHLVKALGGLRAYRKNTPINLLTILEHNGPEDCIWALRATVEDSSDVVARLIAADCAEAVLPIYETRYPDDLRPRAAIEAARDYAEGRIDDATLNAARDATLNAARAATTATAESTAESAAAAAWAAWAAWNAAKAAAGAFARFAAGDAAARDALAEIIRRRLNAT